MPLAKITLELTSPHMVDGVRSLKGREWVHDAQYLLSHNRYGHDFDPGAHDGEYGTHTAMATRRAKYWIGFPLSHVNTRFGPTTYAYLLDTSDRYGEPRPASFRIRSRIRRRRLAALQSHRAKAVALALTQVGTHESPPGSNIVKYTEWYGMTGPWCAMFVSWCWTHVGRPLHYASVAAILSDAHAGRDRLDIVATPQRGDLALIGTDHVGIYLTTSGGNITYVSGNTGSASYADGGSVEVHTIPRSSITTWVRVHG